MSLSRRSFFGAALGAGATLMGAKALGQGRRTPKQAKNVIFLVSDGLSTQTMSMWDHYSRRHLGSRSYWLDLMEQHDVRNGWQETRSLSSVVTDSSAASSTWGSGCRIWNGMVNSYPDGTLLRNIGELVKEKGVRVGLVTTTRITHATPAGFGASVMHRDLEEQIAEEYLKNKIDVLMGGGSRMFDAAKRKDKKDLYAEFSRAGYTIVRTRDEMNRAYNGPVLGTFNDSHLPYTVDRNNSAELQQRVPTLAEMTKRALDLLKDSRNGFLLQVEGGRVDHGGHSNDFGGMFFDQGAFEDAVKAAIEFARNDGETLVIITADHATGGPSLNGAGGEYFDSNAAVENWANIKASYEVLMPVLALAKSSSDIQDAVKQHIGFGLSAAEAEAAMNVIKSNSPFKVSSFYNGSSAGMGVLLGNHLKVTWTSGNHTSEHVPLTAYGPGSDVVHGITPNVDLFGVMCRIFGVTHRNPQMSFIEAKRHVDAKSQQSQLADLVAQYGLHSDEMHI